MNKTTPLRVHFRQKTMNDERLRAARTTRVRKCKCFAVIEEQHLNHITAREGRKKNFSRPKVNS